MQGLSMVSRDGKHFYWVISSPLQAKEMDSESKFILFSWGIIIRVFLKPGVFSSNLENSIFFVWPLPVQYWKVLS